MVSLLEKHGNHVGEVLNKVDHKLLIRLNVLKETDIVELKRAVRVLFLEADVAIRNRVDVSEEVVTSATSVIGEVIVAVRIGNEVKGIENILNSLIAVSEFKHRLRVSGVQYFKVNELRSIDERFNRALYAVVVDVGDKDIDGITEVSGKWRKFIKNFDGTLEDVKTDGGVFVSGIRVNSDSNVYKLFVDVPHGVNAVNVVEKFIGVRKGNLKDYPVEVLHVYEVVDKKKQYLTRKRCSVNGEVVELTVGGVIGDKSIRGIMVDGI